MRLTRVKISNFRSIADETISLDPSCRVLVGINESGKTNVLRALSLLDPEIKPSADDVRDVGPDEDPTAPSEVVFVFATTASERKEAYEFLKGRIAGPIDKPIIGRNREWQNLAQIVNSWSELVFEVSVSSGKRRFLYWEPKDVSFAPGWFCPKKGASVPITIGNEARNTSQFDLLSPSVSELIKEEHRTPVTEAELFAMITAAFATVTTLPEVVYWEYDEKNLLPGSIGLAAFSQDPETCIPLKHMFALAGYSNVAQAIGVAQKKKNGIVNLLNGIARATTKHIVKVWSEFKGLSIELTPNGPNIDATVQDAYNKFDLSRRSDGFKRFISFLLSISVKAKTKELTNTLYLHDEPDTSLHPSGTRYLRNELIRLSDANYVVFSTHSVFMIDRENIGRHLIVEKRNEITRLKQVTESNIVDEEVIYNAVGYSIFEHLMPINILFEGWRDKRLFQVQLSKLDTSVANKKILRDCGVCHAKGVKDIGRITPMLELAKRQWIVVSDTDAVAREQQSRYDGEGEWLRYDQLGAGAGTVTSEDFIEWSAFEPTLKEVLNENPSLQRPTDWESLPGEGKIAKLRLWLESGGLNPERIKGYLNLVKEKLFRDLKVSHIKGEYLSVVESIAAKLHSIGQKNSCSPLALRQ